jgi:hypothetical protein
MGRFLWCHPEPVSSSTCRRVFSHFGVFLGALGPDNCMYCTALDPRLCPVTVTQCLECGVKDDVIPVDAEASQGEWF